MPGAVVGDHVGRADQPGRLDRHQLGVAGAEPDAVQPPCRRLQLVSLIPSSLAIALRAAAAIALPPRRPCTTRCSRPRVAGQRLLGLGRADEADRDADARRPGAGAPSSTISSSRNSAVGALPIGDHGAVQPVAPQLQRGRAAGGAQPRGQRRDAAGRAAVQTTSLSAGSRLRVTPRGDHLRVAQDRRAGPQRRAGRARPRRARRRGRRQVDHARRRGSSGRRPGRRRRAARARSASARMVAKDGR